MTLPENGQLLRIFIGEEDHWHGKPLYEVIVMKALKMNLAGATVTRGIMGYGANSRIHTTKVLRLSEDLPVIIEIADSKEMIEGFLPFLDEVVGEGLITIENVKVVRYVHATKNGSE